MDYIPELKEIAAPNGSIIDNKTASTHGIPRWVLAKLCSEGILQRIARGQYIFSDDIQDGLLSISKRSANLIFSHETALFLHGLSDQIPFDHTVTVPSNRVPSKTLLGECKVYYIKSELFDLGRTLLVTPMGNKVSAYDMERTICDIVRSRSKIGTGTFLMALKAYAANPQRNLNLLNSYAKQMRLAGVISKYIAAIDFLSTLDLKHF